MVAPRTRAHGTSAPAQTARSYRDRLVVPKFPAPSSRPRRHPSLSRDMASGVLLLASPLPPLLLLLASLVASGVPPPCAARGGCPDTVSSLCQPAAAKPDWPTYHLMDNVTRLRDGKLSVEGLNDINAIFQHRGLYHIMNQAGGGDWTNAVSSDLVHWFHLQHALDPTPQSKAWPHNWGGPCDGSLSFPDLGVTPYNGSTPVILYGPDCRCTRARAATSHCGRALPVDARGNPLYAPDTGDAARIEVARPADPSDPYLRVWTKANPAPVSFEGLPCSFPGRIWRSQNLDKSGHPYWNMVCACNGTFPWALYTSSDPNLMSWRPAAGPGGSSFVRGIPESDSNVSRCNGAALFHRIPGAEPDGPTHQINANCKSVSRSGMLHIDRPSAHSSGVWQ